MSEVCRSVDAAQTNIVVLSNASELLARCTNALLSFPDKNHSIIQIATVLLQENPYYNGPYWFCSIEERNEVVGAALYAAPDGLVFSEMPSSAVKKLIEVFLQSMPVPARLIGTPACIDEASASLRAFANARLEKSNILIVGRLDDVIFPKQLSPGHLRRGTTADIEVVREWGRMYGSERPSFLNVSEYFQKKLRSGDLYFWEDGEPVVAMTVSGRSGIGARISSVFTAPQYRHAGYASTAVAMMCKKLLSAGHHFVILTWQQNDKSKILYERIGFYAVDKQMCLLNSFISPHAAR
jgi:GNAT superfamily N-acetyltransferase